jgi:ESS family glutamate:Na+ symporter
MGSIIAPPLGGGERRIAPQPWPTPLSPAACLVLVVGGFLIQGVPPLARYSIPAPIVGGLLFAVLAVLVKAATGLKFSLDTSARGPLLLIFFAMIGLTADLALLRSGGARLLRFIVVLLPFLVLQDGLGVVMARRRA